MTQVRRGIEVVLGTIGDAIALVVRGLFVDVFRNGVIRVKGLSPAVRTIVIAGLVLIFGAVIALVTAPHWRGRFTLDPVPFGQAGRGTLFPQGLVPFTLLLLTIGCALMLAGGVRAILPLRLTVLLVYVAFALVVRTAGELGGIGTWQRIVSAVAIVFVIVAYAVLWRFRHRPALEFCLFLAAAVTTIGIAQSQLVSLDRFSGTQDTLGGFGSVLGQVETLVLPLVFAAGIGVIAFGVTATRWALQLVEKRANRLVAVGLAAVLAAWRLHDVGLEFVHAVQHLPARKWTGEYAGGLGVLAIIGVTWLVVEEVAARGRGVDDPVHDDEHQLASEATRVALPIAGALSALPLLAFVVALGGQALSELFNRTGPLTEAARITGWFANGYLDASVRDGVSVVLIVAGCAMAHRGRRVLGLYAALVGAIDVYGRTTDNWSKFTALHWHTPEADFWLVVGLAAFTAVHLIRRTFTEARAQRVFFALLLTALIRQSTFVSNPVGTLFHVAGVGLVVFGLVWGVVTAGAWANKDTPRFPRATRVMLYLGYNLFSVTLLVWYAGSHQVADITRLQTSQPGAGLNYLGLPLLYTLLALLVVGAIENRLLLLDPPAVPVVPGGVIGGSVQVAPQGAGR